MPGPRVLRLEFPGAIYHVMSRGDRREEISRDDVDRPDFLKALAEICQKIGFAVRRGWCLGSAAFRKEMLERLEGELGEGQAGDLRRASAEVRAERIIAEELRRQGWREADLAQRRKGDGGNRCWQRGSDGRRRPACRQAGDGGVDRGAAEDGDEAEYSDAAAGIQTPEENGKREVMPNRTMSWVDPSFYPIWPISPL